MLIISNFDANMSAKEISVLIVNTVSDGDTSSVKNMFQRLHTHPSNIPGTRLFWTSACYQFIVIYFHQAYMIHIIPSIFNTGSLVEYHDYALRLLLHNYVKALNIPNAINEADAILLED